MTVFAFILVHFGDNVAYLEHELYFLKMLNAYTKNDIIYLYSITDTPNKFVDIIRPNVTYCVGYNDDSITYNIKEYKSNYDHYNTLRTCNFIYAYNLIQYEKVCLIESDMIIMKNLDAIFDLKTPAIFNFLSKNITQNQKNIEYPLRKQILKKYCNNHFINGVNGGILLIKPDINMIDKYKEDIKNIIKENCAFANEVLFLYTNPITYNIPIWYNLSYHHLADQTLKKFGVNPKDLNKVCIYHFNQTNKPVENIKDEWYLQMELTSKNKRRLIPLLQFKKYYDKYHIAICHTLKKQISS